MRWSYQNMEMVMIALMRRLGMARVVKRVERMLDTAAVAGKLSRQVEFAQRCNNRGYSAIHEQMKLKRDVKRRGAAGPRGKRLDME
jgi:hypothetical protein